MQRMIVTLCIISIPFFQSFSKRYSKTNLKIDIPSENIHFRMQYNHPSLSVERELKEEYFKK